MSQFVILIPPSEGKSPDGTHNPIKKVSKRVRPLWEELHNFKGDWEKLLGVKGKALQKAISVNQAILTSPTQIAIERYTGVVYQGIDYSGMSLKAQNFFNEHVRMVSALFGLVAPQDLIPDYKLRINKLKADKYWQPLLTQKLSNSFVIDVLPQSHRKAVAFKNGIFVDFIVHKKGKKVSAGHQGKLIKGRFVRWLCEQRITTPDKFDEFQEDGFQWNGTAFVK